jgi:phosphoribosyl 1,2-cyclic phosphodiesterase
MLRQVRVFVLGSGSSGNCLVIEADGERILIDAGMGPVRAAERMRSLGEDLIVRRPPLGVFVTHDHADHSAHALPLARALRAPVYAHGGARLERVRSRLDVLPYSPGRVVPVGPFLVEAVSIPHDAPHVALRVTADKHRMAVVTDLGHATNELRAALSRCDLVFLEANHCPRLLEAGPYPANLKRRVGGPLGHLANEQAAELAKALDDTRVGRLVLVHLSRTNNTAERAREVVASRVRHIAVETMPHGEARQFEISGPSRPGQPEQLALGF